MGKTVFRSSAFYASVMGWLTAWRRWLPLLAPILVGGLLRAIWLRYHFHELVSDEIAYHALAVNLAEGRPYGLPFWPPGWPALLALLYALFGADAGVGLRLNLALSALTIALTGGLTLQLFGRRAAIASMWLLALMPSHILPVVLLRYEIWLQFLLALGLWASLWLRSAGRWAGLAIGVTVLATLVRPLWLVLPFFLWLVGRFLGRAPVGWRHLTMAQLGAVLLLAPWVWVSSVDAGRFVPIALNGGVNLWIGNNPQATGAYISPPGEYWDPRNEAPARAAALAFMVDEPARVVELTLRKVWYSFAYEPWAEWVFLKTTVALPAQLPDGVQALLNLYYWMLWPLVLGAAAWLVAAGRYRWLLPLLLVAYSVGSQLPFFGTPRFRWTVQFVLIAYAAAFPFLIRASQAAQGRTRRALTAKSMWARDQGVATTGDSVPVATTISAEGEA